MLTAWLVVVVVVSATSEMVDDLEGVGRTPSRVDQSLKNVPDLRDSEERSFLAGTLREAAASSAESAWTRMGAVKVQKYTFDFFAARNAYSMAPDNLRKRKRDNLTWQIATLEAKVRARKMRLKSCRLG
jgi:hypothetical protein